MRTTKMKIKKIRNNTKLNKKSPFFLYRVGRVVCNVLAACYSLVSNVALTSSLLRTATAAAACPLSVVNFSQSMSEQLSHALSFAVDVCLCLCVGIRRLASRLLRCDLLAGPTQCRPQERQRAQNMSFTNFPLFLLALV